MLETFHVVSMELFTLSKWKPMEDHQNTQLTKLVLNMELDIVMLSVLMILNLFKEKPIVRTGKMTKVNMEAAVLKWIFGKPTNKQTPSLPILALNQEIINVQEKTVEMMLIDKMAFVIKMVSTLIPSETETRTFMVQDLIIK